MESEEREQGAEADAYGRKIAKEIAEKLGAESVSDRSNECLWNNSRIVIKCAHTNTQKVGVSYQMLERITGILGAFETMPNVYELFLLDTKTFQET